MVVVVVDLYSASRSACNALVVVVGSQGAFRDPDSTPITMNMYILLNINFFYVRLRASDIHVAAPLTTHSSSDQERTEHPAEEMMSARPK